MLAYTVAGCEGGGYLKAATVGGTGSGHVVALAHAAYPRRKYRQASQPGPQDSAAMLICKRK